jgi:hypothetical protein
MAANSGATPMNPALRLPALRRFATAISALTVLGHVWFGFEQAFALVFVSLGAAYGTELLMEAIDAWARRRPPRWRGGPKALVDFLLSAHITGLACAMLLFPGGRLFPVAFAATAAIASKTLFRVRVNGSTRHFFNPSNFGITSTLLLFPWVGIAPPYAFTENLYGAADWVLPGLIVLSGSFLNARFTSKVPLILAWLGTFAAQALCRSLIFGTPVAAGLVPMTGMAFLLYTFYMVTDPATTPARPFGQVAFGVSVALAYGTLMALHQVFGLFFALTAVCAARGIGMALLGFFRAGAAVARPPLVLAPVRGIDAPVITTEPAAFGKAEP